MKHNGWRQERREGPNARYRVRINVDNILRLAQADRPLKKASCRWLCAAGDAPVVESDGEQGGGGSSI